MRDRRYKYRKQATRWVMTGLLALVALFMITPFLWMLSASMKTAKDVLSLPIKWIPGYFYPDNYLAVWHIGGKTPVDYHFGVAYFNSLKIAFINVFGAVLTSTLAGYAFAKIKFRGSNLIFLLYLSTMMIPSQVTLIPRFVLFNTLRMVGSHLPLILPNLVTITGTFLMRQYFMQVPNELKEAAVMDGAGRWTLFFRIVLPLARPAIVVTALFSFMTAWNEFILAATFLSDETAFTLPVALQRYVGDYSTEWGHFAAGAILVSTPVMALFFALQRHLIGGLTAGGVKG